MLPPELTELSIAFILGMAFGVLISLIFNHFEKKHLNALLSQKDISRREGSIDDPGAGAEGKKCGSANCRLPHGKDDL